MSACIPPSGRNVYVALHRMLSHRGVDSEGERVLTGREEGRRGDEGRRGEERRETVREAGEGHTWEGGE